MIIKFHGETSPNKLTNMLKEIIEDIEKRTGIEGTKYTLKDVEVGVLFNVNGEKMMLSSEIDGVKETFKVHVQLDEKGNVKLKKDNEHESFSDEYAKAVAKGFKAESEEEIESNFKDEELEIIGEEVGGDLKEVHYVHKKTDEHVLRYFRKEKLIGELSYKPKN